MISSASLPFTGYVNERPFLKAYMFIRRVLTVLNIAIIVKIKRKSSGSNVAKSKLVGNSARRSSYFKRNSEPINLDSSDSDDVVVIKEENAKTPKKKLHAEHKQYSAEAPVKKHHDEEKIQVVNTIPSDKSFSTAEEVLKSIPDADESYLKIDPEAAKMNFFQLKAKQQQDAQSEASGPPIDLPVARKNCLNGLTIVFTGVLPSLNREECERVASQYGARITKSVSGRTSLVVIGKDAGPKKVKTIKQKHIKCIDENGFIQLLEKMPQNGGSGESAKKALAKKQKELNDAIAEAEDEERKEKARTTKHKASKYSSTSSNSLSTTVSPSAELWTTKYAPTELKQICGNKSNVKLLYNWLDTWFTKSHGGKYSKGAGIDNYKAVLISGPPGTGKTTAANLVAKLLNYDIVEKNASDFRSKKLLNQGLKVCLDNTSVAGYFKKGTDDVKQDTNDKRFVLIMDEVDGMSSGDNGGVSLLAQFCRITKSPLILICNDKSLPKMRAFDRVCFDMTWRRPTAREMRSRLMTIAHREGLHLDPNVVDELVAATHNDIRQIINIMSTVARTQKTLDFKNTAQIQGSWKKEVALKPFDVVGRLLSSNLYGAKPTYNINEKINLFFADPDMVPLMMHENYRSTQPTAVFNYPPDKQNYATLRQLEKASNVISESDLVNQAVRSGEQQWSLLPFYGIMSTILPGSYICGRVTSRIFFTSWLGQNSKTMKYRRIVQQLQYHSSTKTNTSNTQLRLVYVPYWKTSLTEPLIEKGASGIDDVLKMLDGYYLTKEDWNNIMDLGVGRRGHMVDKLKKIPASVKTALTRKYNSYTHPTIIYRTGEIKMERPRGIKYVGDVIDDDAKIEKREEDDEEKQEETADQDIGKDKLIKAVKKRSRKKSGAGKTGTKRRRRN